MGQPRKDPPSRHTPLGPATTRHQPRLQLPAGPFWKDPQEASPITPSGTYLPLQGPRNWRSRRAERTPGPTHARGTHGLWINRGIRSPAGSSGGFTWPDQRCDPCKCRCGSAEVRKSHAGGHLARAAVRKAVRKCGSVGRPPVRHESPASSSRPRPNQGRQHWATFARPDARLYGHQPRPAGLWTSRTVAARLA